jgi:hypothetical protein
MTLALDGGGWSPSRPGRLYPRERPGTHHTEGWVASRAGLDRCGKSRPHRESITQTPRYLKIHWWLCNFHYVILSRKYFGKTIFWWGIVSINSDFQRGWDLHFSGILRSLCWWWFTDISGQHISVIFKGHSVQEECPKNQSPPTPSPIYI